MAEARPTPAEWRRMRYLAPNLITAIGFVFGLLSIVASIEGRYVDAAWLICYAVMTDRLDGLVARLVRGTSELGVQLDSLADFLNFGLCPAILAWTSLGRADGLPFGDGRGRLVLMCACTVWVMGATYRLGRFNISTASQGASKIFFGVPTTLAAGLLVVWYLTFIKYAGPTNSLAHAEPFGGPELLGNLAVPNGVWRYFPLALITGGLLMASNLRMPKLGLARSRSATVFILANVVVGYICGFARILPEYLVVPPSLWLLLFLVWGQISREARAMAPPRVFPAVDPPPGQEPVRPEDDLYPDGEPGLDEGDVDGHTAQP